MINIAIDGPAGAGKSTVAKEVANKLEFIYVDTGALYRTLAYACIKKNIKAEDAHSLLSVCKSSKVEIRYINGEQVMFLNNENVNGEIRSEEVGSMASVISALGPVREILLDMQRDIAKENNVIMDGRDIGTFVLPKADVKIFLNADASVRAKRRYNQLLEKGIYENLNDIEKEILIRDERDMNRKFAPLKQASDAILIDTSYITQKEVVDKLVEIIKNKTER